MIDTREQRTCVCASSYRIGPHEVECVLMQHPAVSDSAVVSSPDELRGEVRHVASTYLSPTHDYLFLLLPVMPLAVDIAKDSLAISTAKGITGTRLQFLGTPPANPYLYYQRYTKPRDMGSAVSCSNISETLLALKMSNRESDVPSPV